VVKGFSALKFKYPWFFSVRSGSRYIVGDISSFRISAMYYYLTRSILVEVYLCFDRLRGCLLTEEMIIFSRAGCRLPKQ
jgi:hypothetical protein